MKIHSIYDFGDTVADRYTVYYKGRGTIRMDKGIVLRQCVGMSGAPFHPQGFGQHSEGKPGRHNGKKITWEELPKDCQTLVERDLKGG